MVHNSDEGEPTSGNNHMAVDSDEKKDGVMHGPEERPGQTNTAATEQDKEQQKKNEEDEKTPWVWRIPNFPHVLDEAPAGSGKKHYSDEFEKCGFKWRMLMFPGGHPHHKEAQGQMSAYVELKTDPVPTSGAYFDFGMYVMNPTGDDSKANRKESVHEFTRHEIDRGFTNLFPLKDLPKMLWEGEELRIALWFNKRTSYTSRWIDPNYDSKKATGYVGLKNQGATCYMNSFLQTLFHIPTFRKGVYDVPTDHATEKSIALALQRVFYNLQTSNVAVSTKQLTQSFGWDSAESFQQHDVQEFARVLLDSLEERMKKTPVEGTIQRLLEGKSQSYIECINVSYKSERTETFLDLQLNVKGLPSLEKSLEQYVEVETLEKDNQYRTDAYGKQDAKKGTRFLVFPPVLQLQLKRFEYDPMRDMMVKVNDRFEFPTKLNLSKFLPATEQKTDGDAPEYFLHSVLVHSGSVHGGHYYAFIRPINKTRIIEESSWYKFDDETVTKVDEDEATQQQFGGEAEISRMFLGQPRTEKRIRMANAYMLIYLRKSLVQSTNSAADLFIAQGINNPALQTLNAASPAPTSGGADDEKKDSGKGDTKDTDEKKAASETNEAIKHVLDVPIPQKLVERFTQETADLAAKSEQKKKAHLFMDVSVIAENQLFDQPVGIEFQKEWVDSNGVLQYNVDIGGDVKTAKQNTLEQFSAELDTAYKIPVNRQQFWKFTNRENGTRRPNGWIALSSALMEDVWRDHHIRKPTVWLRDLTLEDALNNVNANLNKTLTVENVANTDVGDRCMITIKYFDVYLQKLTVISTGTFFKRDSIRQLKQYMRNCLRVKGMIPPAASAPSASADVSDQIHHLNLDDEEKDYPILAWEEEDVQHNKISLLQDNKTLRDCGLRNGDLVVYQLQLSDEKLEKLREDHSQAFQKWEMYVEEWRHSQKVAAKEAQKATNTSSGASDSSQTQPTSATPTPKLEDRPSEYPVKSEFFIDAPSYLRWLRDRMVIEFRSFPWKPHPTNQLKSHPDVHVFHLELTRNILVIEIMKLLGDRLNVDPLKLKFYNHGSYSFNGRPGPETSPFIKKDPYKTTLADFAQTEPIIYFDRSEFSLQELQVNRVIPVMFVEIHNNFKEYKFNVLVHRKGRIAHFENAVWAKLKALGLTLPEIAQPSDPAIAIPPGATNDPAGGGSDIAVHAEEGKVDAADRKAAGEDDDAMNEEKERESKDDGLLPLSAIPRYPLRSVIIFDRRITCYDNRELPIETLVEALTGREWIRVEIIPDNEQPYNLKEGEESVRWGAFYQPVSQGYRVFGHPFSFVVRNDDHFAALRARIGQRLGLTAEHTAKLTLSLLQYSSLGTVAETDNVMQKLTEQHDTYLFGINDPDRKPKGATGLTGTQWANYSRSWLPKWPQNQSIKIYSQE